MVLATPQIDVGTQEDVWESEDGLRIPKTKTASRVRWLRAFLRVVREQFVEPHEMLVRQRVKVAQLVLTNPVHNHARYDLYRRMVQTEGLLPPLLAREETEPFTQRQVYVLVDGNHRTAAARKQDVDELDVMVIRRRP